MAIRMRHVDVDRCGAQIERRLDVGDLVVADVRHAIRRDPAFGDDVRQQPLGLAEPPVGGGDDVVDEVHVDAGGGEQRRQLRPREIDVADQNDGDRGVACGPEQVDGGGDRPERSRLQFEFGREACFGRDPRLGHQRPDLREGALGRGDLGVTLDVRDVGVRCRSAELGASRVRMLLAGPALGGASRLGEQRGRDVRRNVEGVGELDEQVARAGDGPRDDRVEHVGGHEVDGARADQHGCPPERIQFGPAGIRQAEQVVVLVGHGRGPPGDPCQVGVDLGAARGVGADQPGASIEDRRRQRKGRSRRPQRMAAEGGETRAQFGDRHVEHDIGLEAAGPVERSTCHGQPPRSERGHLACDEERTPRAR